MAPGHVAHGPRALQAPAQQWHLRRRGHVEKSGSREKNVAGERKTRLKILEFVCNLKAAHPCGLSTFWKPQTIRMRLGIDCSHGRFRWHHGPRPFRHSHVRCHARWPAGPLDKTSPLDPYASIILPPINLVLGFDRRCHRPTGPPGCPGRPRSVRVSSCGEVNESERNFGGVVRGEILSETSWVGLQRN